MMVPRFEWDEEANGYISEPFDVCERAVVHIELSSKAPVVTLRREDDGEYANYGQSPESASNQEFTITCRRSLTLRLATPVEVVKCYIIN